MPYLSLNQYLRRRFGEKIYKLALPGGSTCPNRDGTKGSRGCIFCSAGGSGEFTPAPDLSITEQIENAKARVSKKFCGGKFIAYFQSFTATYGDEREMRRRFFAAAERDDIVAVSIATRADCLPDNIIDMLRELNEIKPVFVELGLQSIHKKTLDYIRSGITLDIFDSAVKRLKAAGINVVVHMIIGLPQESEKDILETAEYIAHCGADGIKLQLLHVLKGTDLADEYLAGKFSVLSLEDYTRIAAECIELLPESTVIHRITGDGDKKLLIAPQWSADKRRVLNYMNNYFREKNITQGKNYSE